MANERKRAKTKTSRKSKRVLSPKIKTSRKSKHVLPPKKHKKRTKSVVKIRKKLKLAVPPRKKQKVVEIKRPSRRLAVKSKVRLREAITLLRKHVTGYASKDGFDLSKLETWDYNKRYRVIRRAEKIHELLLTPHDTIKARTKKEKENLFKFTGQRIRGAKHFIVHKPADNFKVGLRDGYVTIDGKFGGRVITRNQFFLFPRRPRYPKELVAMSRRMLKEMPDGFYSILTSAHGDTGEPVERDKLIEQLNVYLAAYEVNSEGASTGFSEVLLGFRFMETTLDGAVVQRRQIDARRQRQREYNAKIRAKAESKERAKVKKFKKTKVRKK